MACVVLQEPDGAVRPLSSSGRFTDRPPPPSPPPIKTPKEKLQLMAKKANALGALNKLAAERAMLSPSNIRKNSVRYAASPGEDPESDIMVIHS